MRSESTRSNFDPAKRSRLAYTDEDLRRGFGERAKRFKIRETITDTQTPTNMCNIGLRAQHSHHENENIAAHRQLTGPADGYISFRASITNTGEDRVRAADIGILSFQGWCKMHVRQR